MIVSSLDGQTEEVRTEMSLSEAIDQMEQAAADRCSKTGQASKLIYIKDWHLVYQEKQKRLQSSHIEGEGILLPYETPAIFRDDWMNNDSFLEEAQEASGSSISSNTAISDDFRFCYAGTSGTKTGLHRDVYASYSWNTNIVGRKRWIMYPPALAPLLRRADGRGRRLSKEEQLHLQELKISDAITVEQEEGQTIFVPSNWFHSVENLKDCVSLNHNWCNSCNLPSIYESLKEAMQETEEAIIDVKEMLQEQQRMVSAGGDKDVDEDAAPVVEPWQIEFHRLVQLISRSDTGWDWIQFWQMIERWLDCETRACEARLHPDLVSFVQPRLRSMVEDFQGREEVPWLDPRVSETVERCKELLEGLHNSQ